MSLSDLFYVFFINLVAMTLLALGSAGLGQTWPNGTTIIAVTTTSLFASLAGYIIALIINLIMHKLQSPLIKSALFLPALGGIVWMLLREMTRLGEWYPQASLMPEIALVPLYGGYSQLMNGIWKIDGVIIGLYLISLVPGFWAANTALENIRLSLKSD